MIGPEALRNWVMAEFQKKLAPELKIDFPALLGRLGLERRLEGIVRAGVDAVRKATGIELGDPAALARAFVQDPARAARDLVEKAKAEAPRVPIPWSLARKVFRI